MTASRLLYSFALVGAHFTHTRATQLTSRTGLATRAVGYATSARTAARAPAVHASAATADEVDTSTKRFITGETGNNVTPYIANLIGRNLHKQTAHPIGIIKAQIEAYFASLEGPTFEIADSMDPLVRHAGSAHARSPGLASRERGRLVSEWWRPQFVLGLRLVSLWSTFWFAALGLRLVCDCSSFGLIVSHFGLRSVCAWPAFLARVVAVEALPSPRSQVSAQECFDDLNIPFDHPGRLPSDT